MEVFTEAQKRWYLIGLFHSLKIKSNNRQCGGGKRVSFRLVFSRNLIETNRIFFGATKNGGGVKNTIFIIRSQLDEMRE